MGTAGTMLVLLLKGVDVMPGDYSLSDVLERLYENQEALQAAIMELTLLVEEQGAQDVGGNVRGALWTMGENAGHIKQGLARLKKLDIG
jgi:phosphoribosyl-AMP cyclohydrolase